MKKLTDLRGVPWSFRSAADVPVFERALLGIVSMEFDPLAGAIEPAPPGDRPAPLILLECFWRLGSMEEEQFSACEPLLAELERQSTTLLPAELLIYGACKKWFCRKFEQAHQDLRFVLGNHPLDILSIYAAHMLEFYMGWSDRMRQTIDSVVSAWRADMPLYGYLKGMQAFALEENGEFDAACAAADVALEKNPRDVYAIHAMCHVHYELGRYRESIEWMNQRRSCWSSNLYMRIHVWWHYALLQLFQMNIEDVLSVYRSEIRRKNSVDGREDLDAVNLLWQLSLVGEDVSYLWKDVAQHWMPAIGMSRYWFNDVHAFMAALGAGQPVLADWLVRQIEKRYSDQPAVAAAMRLVCQGLAAFARQQYDEAADALSRSLQHLRVLGGSNAQRDVFELTAIEAALRCGRTGQARALIADGRCLRHPSALRDRFLARIETADRSAQAVPVSLD